MLKKMGMACLPLLMTSLLVSAAAAFAQNPPPSMEDAIRRSWEREVQKLLAIAKDDMFPADKFDYKFSPGAQSYSEVLWHATRSIQLNAYRLNGMSRQEMRERAQRMERPADRAGMVAVLEKVSQECKAALGKKVDTNMVAAVEHLAEQYGKLVGMYRANNLVPPNSRR